MALKVRKNGAWVDIADSGGGTDTTYDLLGGGTDGGSGTFGTGVGKIILRPSSGDDDEVSITGGSNIRIDGTSATGFTINADTGGAGVADKIQEGNTKAEVIDTGTDGRFLIEIDGVEALRVKNNRELLLKKTATSLEGGHLQFEDIAGSESFAIDVYGNNSTDSVIRLIDQLTQSGDTGTERFCVNRSGAFGIGHVAERSFGTSGYALVSQGASAPPKWEDLSAGAATTFLSLGDTPPNYIGEAHKLVRVNKSGSTSNGNALEFITETTYALSAVDGDDDASEKIKLTPTSGTASDVTLKVINGLSIARDNNLITIDGAGAGTNTTYNLKLSGSNGDSGQAIWTLDGTNGTDTAVTLKAGNNISISSLSATGSGTSGQFQIDAAGPGADTYSLPVTASGTDIKLSLTPLDGTTPSPNQVVTIEKGNNVTLTKTSGNNFKIDVDASSIPGTTYELKATKTSTGTDPDGTADTNPYLFLDASGSETDSSVRLVGSGNVSVTRNSSGNTITIDGSGGSGTGTTYTYNVSNLWTNNPRLRLTNNTDNTDTQDIEIAGDSLSGISVVRTSATKITISANSSIGAAYTLNGLVSAAADNTFNAGSGTFRLAKDGVVTATDPTIKISAGPNIRITGSNTDFKIEADEVSGNAFKFKNTATDNTAAKFQLYPGDDPTAGASDQLITITPGGGISFVNSAQGLTIATDSTTGGATYAIDGIASSSNGSSGIRLTGTNLSSPDNVLIEGAGGITVTGTTSKLTITGGTASDAYSLPVNDNGTGVQIKLTPKSTNTASANQTVSINAGTGIKLTPSGQSFTIEVKDLDQGFAPVGVIVAYYVNGVPGDKWALCNGQVANGVQTPNLMGKFILGGTSVNTQGGNAYYGIGHSHNVNATLATTAGIGDHDNHYYQRVDNFVSGGGDASNRRAPFTPVSVPTYAPPGGFSGRHAHTMNINIDSGYQREGYSVGDNMPPYYTLVYIMRVAV